MIQSRTILYFWTCLTLITCSMAIDSAHARPKAIYDEKEVPAHTLPDPLVDEAGNQVNAAAWPSRRAEILSLFKTHVYGQMPPKPESLTFDVYEQADDALDGKAIRKQVKIQIAQAGKKHALDLLIYIPKSDTPVPTFLTLNFQGNHSIHPDPAISLNQGWMRKGRVGVVNGKATDKARGVASKRWPVEKIIDGGFAVGTIYCGDMDPDKHDDFKDGLHALYPELQQGGDNFTTIGAWAWGLHRAMDYLETDKRINAKRVAVMGHSRLGKTALWAAATDERFALSISNNSGCGGAALSRRRFGESVARINRSFPHWFCDNFNQYGNNENACPVDQHQLISLIAPRGVYVASATGDQWADPRGEFLAAKHGSRVYDLLGKPGISKDTPWPKPERPIHTAGVGYHLRTGKHDVTGDDWAQYMAFFKHLK